MSAHNNMQQIRTSCLSVLLATLAAASGCKMTADTQNLAGVRLYRQGQYDAAMSEFQKAVATDPKNGDAYYNMAATMHRLGVARNDQEMLKQAETLYNQSLDLNEDNAECYRGLGVLLAETGRSDRAFNLMKNWAVKKPDSADARIELARLYDEFGDPESAQLHLTEALQIDQHNSRAWNALGQLREKAGDYQQALANYQHSYQINGFQPQIAERIATLNRAVAGGLTGTTTDGTRTVNAATPTTR